MRTNNLDCRPWLGAVATADKFGIHASLHGRKLVNANSTSVFMAWNWAAHSGIIW